jgi:hypothetical protein
MRSFMDSGCLAIEGKLGVLCTPKYFIFRDSKLEFLGVTFTIS